MTQETVVYMTNIIIAVILAMLLTQFWLAQGRPKPLRCWMISAWIIVLADVLFALRPDLPHWAARFFPTILVTLSHVGLLVGARVTIQQAVPWRWLALVVAMHAVALIYFLSLSQPTHWRMTSNGMFWAGLAFAAFATLRAGPVVFWKPPFSPANIFLLHGALHVTRSLLALGAAQFGWPEVAASLQLFGDLEAAFFTVALFVALLIAVIQQRHEELMSARAEVETLSGLLPICAWCKKVRDDAGYWQQVEDYFERRDRIRFTHGICADCADTFKDEDVPVSKPTA